MSPLWIVLAVLAALILLLAILPLGARVLYSADGFFLFLRAGPLLIRLYPSTREKGKKKAKKEKKPKKTGEAPPKEKEKKKPDLGGLLSAAQEALPLVTPTLKKVKRRLTVDDLQLRVTWASSDPADAAFGFGCANAALGLFWAVVSENFRVKDASLSCDVDFDAKTPTVYAEAALSMTLWRMVTLGLPLAIQGIKIYSHYCGQAKKSEKKEA